MSVLKMDSDHSYSAAGKRLPVNPTLIGLQGSPEKDLHAFAQIWRREVAARQAALKMLPLGAADFIPVRVWRCDGDAWKCARIFASDKNGNVGVIFCRGEKAHLRYFSQNPEGALVPELDEPSGEPLAQDLSLAGRLVAALRSAPSKRATSYIRLWNGRICDSHRDDGKDSATC